MVPNRERYPDRNTRSSNLVKPNISQGCPRPLMSHKECITAEKRKRNDEGKERKDGRPKTVGEKNEPIRAKSTPYDPSAQAWY